MSEAERKDCTVEQAAAEHKVTKNKTFILFACGGTGSNFTQCALFLLKTRQNRNYSQQFVVLDKPSNLSSRRCISRGTSLIELFRKTKVSKNIVPSDFNKKATTALAEKIAIFTCSLFAKTHFNRDSVSFALMEMYQKKFSKNLRLHEYARISCRRIFHAAISPCVIQTSFATLKRRILNSAIGDALCNLTTKYDSFAYSPQIWWFDQHPRRSAATW